MIRDDMTAMMIATLERHGMSEAVKDAQAVKGPDTQPREVKRHQSDTGATGAMMIPHSAKFRLATPA